MNTKPLTAGERIESRCRRCNDITGHIIVAMVGGAIHKVECQACGGVHRYHAPGVQTASARAEKRLIPAKAASGTQAGTRKKESIVEQTWQLAVNQHIGDVKPYAMDGVFCAGDLVAHPTFGQGIVQSVEAPAKMTVLFRDSLRSLRCAG